MIRHPAELTFQDVLVMDHLTLERQLLEFNRHGSFTIPVELARSLTTRKLRRLVLLVRRHYQSKGY